VLPVLTTGPYDYGVEEEEQLATIAG
jgi:hypothetical protein